MARKSKRRTRRKSKKRGGKCEYKKVDGKWLLKHKVDKTGVDD